MEELVIFLRLPLWLSYGYLDGYNGISDLWDFDEVVLGYNGIEMDNMVN